MMKTYLDASGALRVEMDSRDATAFYGTSNFASCGVTLDQFATGLTDEARAAIIRRLDEGPMKETLSLFDYSDDTTSSNQGA